MKFQDLIKQKIIQNKRMMEERLEEIYKQRNKWNAARSSFNKFSIRKRELILIEQQILENLITKTL